MDPQEYYKVRAGRVFMWRDHAHTFIYAANELMKSYELVLTGQAEGRWQGAFQPIMHLYGVAVENLLKALRIAQGIAPVDAKSGKLSKELKHHRLEKLATEAGLPISDVESKLLRRLQDFIESGRYPVGIHAHHGHGATSFYHPEDLNGTLALIQKLDDAVVATRQQFATDAVKVRDL